MHLDWQVSRYEGLLRKQPAIRGKIHMLPAQGSASGHAQFCIGSRGQLDACPIFGGLSRHFLALDSVLGAVELATVRVGLWHSDPRHTNCIRTRIKSLEVLKELSGEQPVQISHPNARALVTRSKCNLALPKCYNRLRR